MEIIQITLVTLVLITISQPSFSEKREDGTYDALVTYSDIAVLPSGFFSPCLLPHPKTTMNDCLFKVVSYDEEL